MTNRQVCLLAVCIDAKNAMQTSGIASLHTCMLEKPQAIIIIIIISTMVRRPIRKFLMSHMRLSQTPAEARALNKG